MKANSRKDFTQCERGENSVRENKRDGCIYSRDDTGICENTWGGYGIVNGEILDKR